MAAPEKDPERALRIATMVRKLQEATEGQTVGDAQVAFANAIAFMALQHPDPEATVFVTIEFVSEVFRGLREHARAGKPLEVVN